MKFVALLPIFFGLVATATLASEAATNDDCHWVGTAPFCQGSCEDGYTTQKKDIWGDGRRCWTGLKAYCCKH